MHRSPAISERKANVMTVFKDELRRAKKIHTCDDCGCKIYRGQIHSYSSGVMYGGDFWYWRAHKECRDAALAIHYMVCTGEEEVAPLKIVEDLQEWRGDHPHAVCNVERARTLHLLALQIPEDEH